MKSRFSILLLLSLFVLCSLALLSCSSSDQPGKQVQDLELSLDVDPNPAAVGPSHLAVNLTGAGGNTLEGAVVSIEANMDHGEMQPLLASLRSVDDSSYEAPFTWTMAGSWTMAVTAKLPDGQEISQKFQVNVNDEDQGHDHHDDEHPARVPNEGSEIRILEPSDGAVYAAGSDIRVAVEFEEFDLAHEGNHWHIYDNGMSAQMVMGGMNEATLRDLEPGQHELSVYMSIDNHEELEDGASVTITVSE